MNGELIDRAWHVLPNEFKEEVKKRYKGCLFTANRYAKVEADLLEEFFGINNLTSDAEGEEDEMLYVSRKQVQEIYSQNQKEIHRECVSSSDKDCYETVNEVLKTLFGSKCLPDNVDSSEPNSDGLNEDNFAKSEPKPAESKYHIGQRVRHIPTRLVDVIDGISQSAPYIYHFKHMVDPINGQGIFESDLEPYTGPKNEYSERIHAESVQESRIASEESHLRNLSQSMSNCDKHFDTILKDSFSKERRLNIAASIAAGWLACHGMTTPETIAMDALAVADALVIEVKKQITPKNEQI